MLIVLHDISLFLGLFDAICKHEMPFLFLCDEFKLGLSLFLLMVKTFNQFSLF